MAYDFKEWINKYHNDSKFTPEIHQIIEDAYHSGYTRGESDGWKRGRFIHDSDLKKKIQEFIDHWEI